MTEVPGGSTPERERKVTNPSGPPAASNYRPGNNPGAGILGSRPSGGISAEEEALSTDFGLGKPQPGPDNGPPPILVLGVIGGNTRHEAPAPQGKGKVTSS